jgi:hypothetical protein
VRSLFLVNPYLGTPTIFKLRHRKPPAGVNFCSLAAGILGEAPNQWVRSLHFGRTMAKLHRISGFFLWGLVYLQLRSDVFIEIIQRPVELSIIPIAKPAITIPMIIWHMDYLPTCALQYTDAFKVCIGIRPAVLTEMIAAINFNCTALAVLLVEQNKI